MEGQSEEPTSVVSGFFGELRRRKVFRVAAGYTVVGWLVIQVAATTFPALDLPNWALRFVILALLAGFPIALVLAWAFDIGPQGFEKTESALPQTNYPRAERHHRRGVYFLALAGLLIAAVAAWLLLPRFSTARVEKSIAVLPFDNFSEDKENEHFADGIQDDLLTSLAKIGDLKVISRTSVMSYKGKAHNMREIGRALGVGALLEGSVRRDGNRVRVNVQLIKAATDEHLWAEIYEREVTDVFALQSALAQEIASQLKAKLSPDEKALIDRKPTENSEAYLLSVQAHELFNRPDRRHNDVAAAEKLYKRAVEIDPTFALAHARLAQLQSWFYYGVEASPARAEKARRAASEARRLQPNLAEAHLAQGLVLYYIERDYDAALKEMAAAQDGLPNDSTVLRSIAAIQRRQGKWDESTASYRKAAAVEPRDVILFENLSWNHLSKRNYPAATKTLDRAIAMAPDTFTLREMRTRVDFYSKGDLKPLERLLASLPEDNDPNGTITLTRFNLLMYQRRFDDAIAMLKRSPAERSRGETSAPISKAFLFAMVYRSMGDEANARSHFEEAREKAEVAVQENPKDAPRHALLALIYAGLSRCDEAKRLADRAVELLPETRDAFDGPLMALSRARCYMMCGDHATALETLERSLKVPAGITVSELRFDPVWDPLRNETRFQKLVTGDGANAR